MNRTKYPRTVHFPWSPGATSDDKTLTSTDQFVGKEVVVTEKMDGENTTIYHGGFTHARSLDSAFHPSREWIRRFAGEIGHLIPEDMRICGENLYAQHSIPYNGLKSYFYGFSIWDEHDIALSWDETIVWFELLGIATVPVLYRGVYDETIIKKLWDESKRDVVEGYVCRLATAISYDDFQNSVAKFVRPSHVQTSEHWMHETVVKNELASVA